MSYAHAWVLAMVVLAGGIVWAESVPPVPERGMAAFPVTVDKGVEVGWSTQRVTPSPSGKHTFLGPFGSESTVLTVENLPEHARVRVTFDVMIILTWDGDANLDAPGPTTPDLFDVTVEGGPRLVHASFTARPSSANPTTQSFPGRFPYDHVPAGTGAVESRTLGYVWGGSIGNGPDDYVYRVQRTFGHTGKVLKIAFSGINLEPDGNELWGLENVRVEVLSAVAGGKLDEAALGKLWADLGSTDPKAFVPAIDRLVEMGDSAVAFIRPRVAALARDAQQEMIVEKLIAQLDAESFAEREKATAALRETGAAAESALREAWEKTHSEEVRARIHTLLKVIRNRLPETESERRLRRTVEVLELIRSAEAQAELGEIAGRNGTLAAWESKKALLRLEGTGEVPTKLDLPPGLPQAVPVGQPASLGAWGVE